MPGDIASDPALELELEPTDARRSFRIRPGGATLTAPGPRGVKWTLQGPDGGPSWKFDLDSATDVDTVARHKRAGVTAAQLRSLCDRALAMLTVPAGAEELPPFTLRQRPRFSRDVLNESQGDPAELFRAVLAEDPETADLELEWDGRRHAVALDIDPAGGMAASGQRPLARLEVEDMLPASLPQPLAAWVTHGGGLRLLFVAADGLSASALADAWALFAPRGRAAEWAIQAKSQTAHPFSPRDGRRCDRSTLIFRTPSARMRVPRHREHAVATDAQIAAWLDRYDAKLGGRLAAAPCCGAGGRGGEVLEDGVWCHRCEAFFPWEQLCEVAPAALDIDEPSPYLAAREYVEFAHQRLVLPGLTREAWRLMVLNAQGALDAPPEDPRQVRASRASKPEGFVRLASGAWAAGESLSPVEMKVSFARQLPWAKDIPARVAQARATGHLPGYIPVQPVAHAQVLAPHEHWPGVELHRLPAEPGDPDPLEVGEVMPTQAALNDAHAALAERLPQWSEAHTTALRVGLLAGLDARHRIGSPPLVILGGPTGSGKSVLPALVGRALGGPTMKVAELEPSALRRAMGLGLEAGAAVLHLDEIGHRGESAWATLGTILDAGSTLSFAAKYRNEVAVPFTAAIFATGSTIPQAWAAGEVGRRAVRINLPSLRGTDWREFVDLERVREDEQLSDALRLLLSDAYHALAEGGAGSWRRLALQLGALDPSKCEDAGPLAPCNAELYRELYALYRLMPDSQLREDGSRGRWWVRLRPSSSTPLGESARRAREIFAELLGQDDFPVVPTDERRSCTAMCRELDRSLMNELLGLPGDAPDIYLRFDFRGPKLPRAWRFRIEGRGKGGHPSRSELPPGCAGCATSAPGDAPPANPHECSMRQMRQGSSSPSKERECVGVGEGGDGESEWDREGRMAENPGASGATAPIGGEPPESEWRNARRNPGATHPCNRRGFLVDQQLVNLIAATKPDEPNVRGHLRRLSHEPDSDGRVRDAFRPRGCISGRYVSAWHGLPRTPLTANQVEEALAAGTVDRLTPAGLLRPCIIPAPGHVFIQADWRQLQARIVTGITGEVWPEGDPYEAEAARLGVDGPGARDFGKVVLLSLQFGMGAAELTKKAREAAVDWAALGLNPKQAVGRYRESRPLLREKWRDLESTQDQSPEEWGYLLPSGRGLRYESVEVDGDRWSYVTKGGRETARGPALLSHVAQGIEVDLLDDALSRAEVAGLNPVFHLHDCIVVEVREAQAQSARETLRQIMTTPPAWLAELDGSVRLDVETQITRRMQ